MNVTELPLSSPEFIAMLQSCGKRLDAVAAGLLQSYASDGPQFIRDEVVTFPPRLAVDELGLLQEIFFPKYFNCFALTQDATPLKQKLLRLAWIMFCGVRPYFAQVADVCRVLHKLFEQLQTIRETLKTDVHAAFCGDPASSSYTEIIRSYPGFLAVLTQRVAHVLYEAGAPVYPRELTELAHRHTGCDIHPGATIGDHFFIDHATGTVIGETALIGSWVRLYQNVTIGALHFAPDNAQPGMLRKGYKRHPTIGSRVVIGSGAKLLGPITIGDDVSIGANAWLQEDVPPCTAVVIKEHPQQITKVKKPTATPPPPPAVVQHDPTAERAPSGLARSPELR